MYNVFHSKITSQKVIHFLHFKFVYLSILIFYVQVSNHTANPNTTMTRDVVL